ncbi:MAG: DUF1419 domain-containing protein [Tsuneonella suprasediminis]
MTQDPPFRKIFDGIATRKQMFELFPSVDQYPLFMAERSEPGTDGIGGDHD